MTIPALSGTIITRWTGALSNPTLEPFPHFYIEDVFPDGVHQELLNTLPGLSVNRKDTVEIEKLGGTWSVVALTKEIGDLISERLGTEKGDYKSRLVRDPSGYSLGPHTDDPKKVWAFVYYLTGENGTTLFTPKKQGFKHDGLAHLDFNDFNVAKRCEFKPNSMVGFRRTDTSFHGVEKIKGPRWTILYNCFRG